MNFLNHQSFWNALWTAYFILFLTFIPWDIIAVSRGKADHVGDGFTFTHWIVVKIGLSVLGAFIGYLVAHFLIQHRNG